jgi:uncharacterized cupin superfamily protein
VSVQPQTTQAAFLDAAQVLHGPLPEEISMAPVLEGAPFAYEKKVFDGADGLFAIWACGAGVFPRVKDKRGSFMYIISGDATIVDEDGTSHELTADSVLVLPFGWAGTWHIRETIRKVYLHTTPAPPLPSTVVASAFLGAGRVLADALPDAAAAPGSPAPGSPAATDTVVFDGPDGRCDIQSREPGQHQWAADEHGSLPSSWPAMASSPTAMASGTNSRRAAPSRSRAAGQAPGISAIPSARSACAPPPRRRPDQAPITSQRPLTSERQR